ncbi:MAG: PKD domain-containing protein [Limnohabitans sp.]|nr:PKD domain-containing protein [Limnohabitans sp.]
MKTKLLISYLLISLTAISQNTPKNILFIGNSITYFNDMPIIFRDMANNKGKNVSTDMYAPGGTGFVNHVDDNAVYDKFRSKIWDAVVLQPGSGESAGVSWPVNTTIQRGQKLVDSIRKYSPCAKIFLYQIPYGVKSTDGTTGDYDNYQTTQTKIKDSITKLTDGLRLQMVPAGECARMHYTAQQDLLLHSTFNDIHPNLNGSYLVAAAMFTTIFQEPITGCTSYSGVTQLTAEYFQGIADQVVLTNKPLWRINTHNLHAEFNYTQNNATITFTNLSTNYTNLEWDFGDTITSTDANPIHTYSTNGVFTVKLKVISNGCEEIFTKIIDLSGLSTSVFTFQKIELYPNPTQNELNFVSPIENSIKIIDSLGKTIWSSEEKKKIWKINVSNFASGIYFLTTNTREVYRFVKS